MRTISDTVRLSTLGYPQYQGVARGAPVIGHPIGEFDLPLTTHIVAVFRGPFLLPLSDFMALRPDDIVILVGLRHDLAHWLPHFQRPAASKSA